MKLKVGIGYDVHRLEQGVPLYLGGIEIENSPVGAIGHSDADCLLHAVIDALLGAANMRDIGYNYPDTDDKYKGIDSKELLKDTVSKIKTKGYSVENIDSIIVLQRPKLKDFIEQMQVCIAEILHIDNDDVTIKATTTEQLGFTGSGQGVACYSVALLKKE